MSFFAKAAIALDSLLAFPVLYWPGPVGRRLRYAYFKGRLARLGRGVVFDVGVQIVGPEWVSIGDNTWIDSYVVVLAGPPREGDRKTARRANPDFAGREGEVTIGANCHIAPHCVLSGHGGLAIGDNVGVGAGSRVYSLSHHYRDLDAADDDATVYKFSPMVPAAEQALISSPVVLASDSAVGLNSVLLPGARLGRGSWLGACSLLRGTLGPGVIASGVPAVAVKQRFSKS